MKTTITGIICAIVGVLGYVGFIKSNSYPVFYDKNGQLTGNQVKIWGDTVVPTTANGYTIDYSSAGFTTVKEITVTPQLNTNTIGSMPILVIKSFTNTSCVVNILTQNNAVVSILGINVLSGAPLQFATSTSGMILHVEAKGY